MSSSTLPSNVSPHHHRAASLSVARSPSILASTSLTNPQIQTTPDEHDTGSTAFPLFLPASNTNPQPLTRTTSHPTRTRTKTRSMLTDISAVDDRPSIPLKRTVTFDATDRIRRYNDDGGDGEDGLDDLESVLSDPHGLAEMGDDDAEVGTGGRRGMGYAGGFQKPDSKELMAIGLSIVGVTVLSLAAGLATVYDWVL